MNRREFLKILGTGAVIGTFGIIGCGEEKTTENASGLVALSAPGRVTLYDTNAMALYFDGDLGPKTGIIKVDYVIKNEPVTLEFWHGHGGVNHKFTVTPDHFREMKKLKRIYLETSSVAGHTHRLFIDTKDPKWRVTGASPVEVPDESGRFG